MKSYFFEIMLIKLTQNHYLTIFLIPILSGSISESRNFGKKSEIPILRDSDIACPRGHVKPGWKQSLDHVESLLGGLEISTLGLATSLYNRKKKNLMTFALAKRLPYWSAAHNSHTFHARLVSPMPSVIKKHGYPVEIHKVVTSDGYILEAHRICTDKEKPTVKPPVLMLHGILGSSADFIIMGPNNSLGYLLADAGYDVWLLNARGNFYSREHSTLKPQDRDFWKFSWDEIGNLDLPAYIEYILDITEHPKVHYIGHSQGGTAFFVLTSLNPSYNDKIISFHGLAPAVFFTHYPNRKIRTLATFEGIFEKAATLVGYTEVGGQELPFFIQDNYCFNTTSNILQGLCDRLVRELSQGEYRNKSLVPAILGHVPAGASIRQFAHFGQLIKSDRFRRYNYNLFTNLKVYGRPVPPNYNLTKVTVPIYLYYGLNDELVDYRDLVNLSKVLPNVMLTYKVLRDSFNHYDFIWATDARKMLYYSVVNFIESANKNQN